MNLHLQQQAVGLNPELFELLDALPFFALLVDSKHRVLFANKAVAKQAGKTRADVLGKCCPLVVHQQGDPVRECPLVEAVERQCAVERQFYDEAQGVWLNSAVYPTQLKTDENDTIYFHLAYDVTARRQAEEELRRSFVKLNRITNAVIRALTVTVEKRDPYTAGHQQRVSSLAQSVATHMGLSPMVVEGIRVAGLVHDIGKIAVPIEILSKPGKISEYEFQIIKAHPEVGHEIIKEIEFPWPVADIVLQHHERINGSGYPRGLSGDDILLEARILAVADVIEAMTSHRPYREALGREEAIKEIVMHKGTLYDAEVVEACVALLAQY